MKNFRPEPDRRVWSAPYVLQRSGSGAGKYNLEKKCRSNTVKGLEEAVPKYDRADADQMKSLETASCMYSKDPVNLCTGNFIYDKMDLKVKGRLGLSFCLFYNALEERRGVMGRGWIYNYEMSVREEGEVLRVLLAGGKEEQYRADENGGFSSIRGSLGMVSGRQEDRI